MHFNFTFTRDLDEVRGTNGTLTLLTWINIPLVYTQVVTIAVHAFFLSTLFGRQVVITPYREEKRKKIHF